jgi:hypothetical protein
VCSGVQIFLDALQGLRARAVPIRVLTTTYTGMTQPRALDANDAISSSNSAWYLQRRDLILAHEPTTRRATLY